MMRCDLICTQVTPCQSPPLRPALTSTCPSLRGYEWNGRVMSRAPLRLARVGAAQPRTGCEGTKAEARSAVPAGDQLTGTHNGRNSFSSSSRYQAECPGDRVCLDRTGIHHSQTETHTPCIVWRVRRQCGVRPACREGAGSRPPLRTGPVRTEAPFVAAP